MLPLLIRLDFLEIRVIDLVDIFLVALLIYFLYKLLKGTIAFSIFMGLVSIYFIWWAVKILGMQMLSTILGQFIGVGVIALIIVFQQEIRKFLLIIGQSNILTSDHLTFRSVLPWNWRIGRAVALNYEQLLVACDELSKTKTGALIVLAKAVELKGIASTGTTLEAELSSKLLMNIFVKNSPLHDGAVIISRSRIKAASCILPVSDNPNMPGNLGLRHRAGLGMSEQSDALVIIISEQTGKISFAHNGHLMPDIGYDKLKQILEHNFF
jgi:diadenylate cyclase